MIIGALGPAVKMPKTAGGWVSLIFKVFGIVAITSPAIEAITTDIQGNSPQNIPKDIVFNYTGWNPYTNSMDYNRLGRSVASVGGGVALIAVGKWLGKAVR